MTIVWCGKILVPFNYPIYTNVISTETNEEVDIIFI